MNSNSGINWDSPQWEREKPRSFWDPGAKLLLSIRDYQKLESSKGFAYRLRQKACVLRHRFWGVICGAEIDLNCTIAGGLLLPHPNGIVIHPDAQIGPNCLILQQVTLTKGVRLGTHVDIGAGAKLLGPMTVGNHVRIGANAVVKGDVEEGQTMVGIPAKPLTQKSN